MTHPQFAQLFNQFRQYQNDIWSRRNAGKLTELESNAMMTNEAINAGMSLYRHTYGIEAGVSSLPRLVDKITQMAEALAMDCYTLNQFYLPQNTRFLNAEKLLKEWIHDDEDRKSSIDEDDDANRGTGPNEDPGFA